MQGILPATLISVNLVGDGAEVCQNMSVCCEKKTSP